MDSRLATHTLSLSPYPGHSLFFDRLTLVRFYLSPSQFELLKPLARKASLERRSSMDPLSPPVLDELHPPNVVVARRSASGPAGTSTPKPLPETDEYGFFLRPGKKSMRKQDGPTVDEFRVLEQKWVSLSMDLSLLLAVDEGAELSFGLFLAQLGIISSTTLASVQKNKKNKKLVRGGLPASLRGRIWAFLLDSQSQRRQGLFDQLCVVSPSTFEMEDAASKFVLPCILSIFFLSRASSSVY